MKLALISTYLPKHCGIATYTDYLIRGIKKADSALEIKIIAEQGASLLKQDKLEVVPCWDRNENYVEPIISHTKGADVVHIQHEYSIYKFDDRLPSVLHGMEKNTRKIITIHCVRPTQFSERGAVDEDYAARVAGLADEVIVHLSAQQAILNRLGIPSKKIHVIPHGTELSDEDQEVSRKRLGLPVDAKILLMFGFVKPHKNFHIVIDALVEIRKKFNDVCFFMPGGLAPTASDKDKEYAELVFRKIEDLKLENNVIYPNKFFPNQDVPFLLRSADIILFPYCEEDRAASGSFHLAIGALRPVIASRIPKFEELKNINDELLILPYNSSGIAGTVIRLFEDKDFWQYVIDRTDDYRKLTSWETVARQHVELYRRS
ncbi:MAG TPA: glycosyltransferase [Desulfobacterales bacterium]|nr:glycosyltransferase [Desulfobacterales bacterium]